MTTTVALTDDWTGWIDDRWRGFPTGYAPLPIAQTGDRGWRPQDGRMALPLISLDLAAFEINTEAVMRHLSTEGALIAPHAKTPMSVAIARRLQEAGAWGATVADARQASVMLEGGLSRLILANQVGGAGGARRLASLLWHHPLAEVHVFVDSIEGVDALAAAWKSESKRGKGMPPMGLMVELGAGRAGIRDDQTAIDLVEHIGTLPPELGLRLSGLAGYEGAATVADPVESERRVDALMLRMADLHGAVRSRLGPGAPLILTAGGSLWFDRVLARLGSVASSDGRTRLILRSGALFFSDHGVYKRGLAAMESRGVGLAARIMPALRLWAEVLSVPETNLVIAGIGMRDAASDQGVPMPLKIWRDGQDLGEADHLFIEKFNDQHAFIRMNAAGLRPAVGDVIEFGLSHPCTNLDRHRLIWGLDPDHRVRCALSTSFG
ncbi:MAG: alanine racemase protein [Rhizobium sp.]|nr:alanine racemase protein [Rhizobium sp.]